MSDETLRMPILDVRTRWGSTHDMLDLAVRCREALKAYVDRHDLESLALSEEDWNGIELATKWLEVFRNATYDMSMTKNSCANSRCVPRFAPTS
ncbi:hypothetical protein BT69DRAFT_89056 [Atractiella rhizophila]|nr:hypothetical protein BT69DRAFT_89056 [Atractiella rhizophila]